MQVDGGGTDGFSRERAGGRGFYLRADPSVHAQYAGYENAGVECGGVCGMV